MKNISFPNKPVLSICISLKNRSCLKHGGREIHLFPNCIKSIAQARSSLKQEIEIVISDFESDDWPLAQWIHQISGNLNINIIPMKSSFSRGKGLNHAVINASSDHIFLCDADIMINDFRILQYGINLIDQGKVGFPICLYLDENGHDDFWQESGTGLVFLSREVFNDVGGVPEFQSWGGEDDCLYERVHKKYPTERKRIAGLVHQWHPEFSRHQHYKFPPRTDHYNSI